MGRDGQQRDRRVSHRDGEDEEDEEDEGKHSTMTAVEYLKPPSDPTLSSLSSKLPSAHVSIMTMRAHHLS